MAVLNICQMVVYSIVSVRKAIPLLGSPPYAGHLPMPDADCNKFVSVWFSWLHSYTK